MQSQQSVTVTYRGYPAFMRETIHGSLFDQLTMECHVGSEQLTACRSSGGWVVPIGSACGEVGRNNIIGEDDFELIAVVYLILHL